MNIPYFGDDQETAARKLRAALAWISERGVVPTPTNIRLAYDHVSGSSQELSETLEHLTRSGGPDISASKLWDLYTSSYIENSEALETIRRELRQVVVILQRELSKSSNELSDYAAVLNRFSSLLSKPVDSHVSAEDVQKVANDTVCVERSQGALAANISSVMKEVDELKDQIEQIRKESLVDVLTGIANRRAFDVAFEKAISEARAEQSSLSLVLIDIDHFKKFNDTYGHLVGDKVLRFVASTIKLCLKGKDLVARIGGEEFAAIMTQTEWTDAEKVCEQIRSAVSSGQLHDRENDQRYGQVTVSIGVAQSRTNDLPHDIIKRADRALYKAKSRGRNMVLCADKFPYS